MDRSADWLHQARADLAQAQLSADAGHHEWACFACHQAVEKALKALHLHHGQQSWGHGLGRSFRDLPAEVASCLDAQVADLQDIPTAFRRVHPPITSAACKARTL